MSAPVDHFFIVGGQRCGTSYLCQLMDEHPEIEMARPFRPEPKYFLRDMTAPGCVDQYESTFFGAKPAACLRGEKSTSYMESRAAAQQLAVLFPQAKVVFILRDPVDRAISHYWLSVENGFETLPITEAFRREEERRDGFDPARVSVSPFAYLSRGRYIDALGLYEEFFPRERIAVLLYEQLVSSVEVVQQLYEFLGVSAAFLPAAAGRRINAGSNHSSELPPELAHFVQAYFAEPTARLSSYLGRDLSQWWKVCAGEQPGNRKAI